MISESKLVRTSLIILVLSVAFVYSVFYSVKKWTLTEISKADYLSGKTLTGILTEKKDQLVAQATDSIEKTATQQKNALLSGLLDQLVEENSGALAPSSEAAQRTSAFQKSVAELFAEHEEDSFDSVATSGKVILKGTALYDWQVESREKIEIFPDYILKDKKKKILYWYLGDEVYDFKKIAKTHWGNSVEIKTEKDIIKNKLFGKKIIFINLPEYKNILVLMVVVTKKGTRLLEIPYKDYHKSKEYLKNIFTL